VGTRIENHIVLGEDITSPSVKITVDGKVILAKEGEPVLAALLGSGIKINRYTAKRHEPRGLFCGIGQCTDCAMVVDGVPNVRTCVTPVREGMIIQTQDGLGPKETAYD